MPMHYVSYFIIFIFILFINKTDYFNIYRCDYTKVYKLKAFNASNLARHYTLKHLEISTNKQLEKSKKRSKLFFIPILLF
jgi:hypothetical protein